MTKNILVFNLILYSLFQPKNIYPRPGYKSQNLSSGNDEIPNTQDILGKNILDRIKEMEAKIAAVL